MLDRETVAQLLQNNLDAKLNSELSKYGYQLDVAHKLFRFITSIFERTPPELITWKFKVIIDCSFFHCSNSCLPFSDKKA